MMGERGVSPTEESENGAAVEACLFLLCDPVSVI